MKSKYVLIAFVLFCCSCQELIMKNRPFPAVDAGRIEIVPISEEKGEIIKVTNEIGENIPASKLIEDFFYVPLESIEESLFAYCNQIEVFEDKIFVFDRTGTEKLFIFRKNGKFLKSIGEKGGAPFEFFNPRSFAIDREKKQIVIYDNQKRKWMHFSLDGNYIDSDDVPFRTICNFQISSTGYYITATSKGDWNNHLGPIADYKLLYTDSLGNLQKAACYYQESEHNQLVYDPVRRLENDILYVPMYLNEVYTVTDTTLSLRYKFDYSEFTPFEKEKIATFENYDELRDYRSSHTYLSTFAENSTHLFFLTSDNGNERLVSIYDKRSKKLLQVSGIQCDTDFIFDFIAGIHAYEDYFIAMILPQSLRMLKSQLEKNHYPVKEENMRLFENVKEDDNLVLVFFKIKDL